MSLSRLILISSLARRGDASRRDYAERSIREQRDKITRYLVVIIANHEFMTWLVSMLMTLFFTFGFSLVEKNLTEENWQMNAFLFGKTIKKPHFEHNMDPKLNNSKYQSRKGETAWNDFFCGLNEGIVLESGSLDGLRFSSTYALVHTYNWNAVHLEANPSEFVRLQHNRPESINVETAICMYPKEEHNVHANKPAEKCLMKMQCVVSCVPLGWILKRLNIYHFNWFVINVKGGEFEMLKAVNFSEVSFDVITVGLGGDADQERKINTLLQENHYLRVRPKKQNLAYQQNAWFMQKAFQPVLC
eukprot:g30907.t1